MKVSLKTIVIFVVALCGLMPVTVLADGEEKTNTVEVKANNTNGSVTENVGNINVTTMYNAQKAYGILATATDGKLATVNANDVTVKVDINNNQSQTAVSAMANEVNSGRINISTNKIESKGDGVFAVAYNGSKISITTGGIVTEGYGVEVESQTNSEVNLLVNGNIDANVLGLLVNPTDDETNTGAANITVNGDVKASNGTGLHFMGSASTADVLITGTISGDIGVSTDTQNWPNNGTNKLTVWKIESNHLLVTKIVGNNQGVVDDDFAKKINYIIRHHQNVLLKKPNGSLLDKIHGLSVAKEGERIIIGAVVDGVDIKKAFNNGIEITTIDENGNFYMDVPRGGGINLTITTGMTVDACPNDPNKVTPGVCGCGTPDVDTDGDGVANCMDICPNDPLNATKKPFGGCFISGSNIPEKYDPKAQVLEDYYATPQTKPLPPYIFSNGKNVTVYFERFAGGVIKAGDKPAKTKYEVKIKTKNKKGTTTKTVFQALSKNSKRLMFKKGLTYTVQYRLVMIKKNGKKSVTKRSKWSKTSKYVCKVLS